MRLHKLSPILLIVVIITITIIIDPWRLTFRFSIFPSSHDWSDEYCVRILSNLASAMVPETSRILICDQLMISTLANSDPIIPSAPAPLLANYGVGVRFSHQRDLCMMGIINGIESTPAQLQTVVEKSGLKIEKVWECRSQVPVVEVRLAASKDCQMERTMAASVTRDKSFPCK